MWRLQQCFQGLDLCSLVSQLSFTGFSKLPGHSGTQLQVSHIFLDPGFTGVSTDLPASSGLKDNPWLGALAAGLKIVSYELAWNLLGDIGEAAGSWGVSTNCGGRERTSLDHGSEGKVRSEIGSLEIGGKQLCSGCGLGDRVTGRHWASLPRNTPASVLVSVCILLSP